MSEVKILEEMLEDVEDLIDTHDKAAANGAGIDLYQRITLSELKDKINLLGDLFRGGMNE